MLLPRPLDSGCLREGGRDCETILHRTRNKRLLTVLHVPKGIQKRFVLAVSLADWSSVRRTFLQHSDVRRREIAPEPLVYPYSPLRFSWQPHRAHLSFIISSGERAPTAGMECMQQNCSSVAYGIRPPHAPRSFNDSTFFNPEWTTIWDVKFGRRRRSS